MTIRFPELKKLAGVAVMAAAVSAVGLALGSGTAQASPKNPQPQPHSVATLNHLRPHPLARTMGHQRVDNFLDGIQTHFGIGEGTMFDTRVDAFFGVS